MITLLTSIAAAQTADFDTLAEGTNGSSIPDGGLLFGNLDNRGLSPPPGNMAIDQADGDLTGVPGFTPNNALGFGGYSAGPGGAYGRFGSMDITSGAVATSAELTVFETGFHAGLTIQLDAMLGGVVVATDSQPLNAGFGVASHTLSVSGAPFDTVHLSVGPLPTDAAFILVDHVVFSSVIGPDTGDTGVPADTSDTGVPAETADTGGPVDTDDTDLPVDTDDTDLPVDTDDTDTPGPGPDTDSEPTDDGGPSDDTGTDEDDKGGCGCSTDAPVGGALALVPLLLLRRRRR